MNGCLMEKGAIWWKGLETSIHNSFPHQIFDEGCGSPRWHTLYLADGNKICSKETTKCYTHHPYHPW